MDEWAAARLAEVSPKPISAAAAERLRQQTYDLMAQIDARRQSEGYQAPVEPKLTRDQLHDRNALR